MASGVCHTTQRVWEILPLGTPLPGALLVHDAVVRAEGSVLWHVSQESDGKVVEDQGVTAGVVQAGVPGVPTRNVRFEPSEARGPPSGGSFVAGGHRFGIAGLPPTGVHITGCPTTVNDADIAEMLKSLQDPLLSATPGIPNYKTRMRLRQHFKQLFQIASCPGAAQEIGS